MVNNKSVTGIILVAGNSTRYGQNRNKNFEKIKDKFVFQYSVEEFNKNKLIDDIIIAVKEDEKNIIQEMLSAIELDKNIKLVIGGNSRKESVYNCITKTNSDIVIIQDGARPYIQQHYIDKCIQSMEYYKGVSIAVKSKDTVKITNDNGVVVATTNRKNTWIIQTPQCFDRKILLQAHEECNEGETITDDCMLLERKNYEIKLLEGDYENIKITNYNDLKNIQAYF